MRRVITGLLIASLALAGCAARSTKAADASTAKAGEAAAGGCAGSAKASRWREMTWAEYYTEIRERAWKRGILVIWITPPEVTKRKRVAAHSAPTACAR